MCLHAEILKITPNMQTTDSINLRHNVFNVKLCFSPIRQYNYSFRKRFTAI